MRKPFVGSPTTYKDYFRGNTKTHMVGVLGGLIWGLGNLLSLIAAEKAGAAISYGLGQGATMVAAFWGVFIWKEFKNGPKINNVLLTVMFVFFIVGLGFIIWAGN
jgi:glucose uptake protein